MANPIPKQRPKPRPLHNHRRSKLPTTTDPTDDDIEFVEANPRQNRTRDVIHDSEAEPPASKSKAKSKAPKEANDGLGTLQTSQIGKGKGKSKTGTNATPANEIDDVDIADTTSPAKKRGRPKGGAKVGTRADKRSQNLDKADGDAAFREDEEPATKTRKGKGPSKAKPNEWQTSVTARDADSEEERVSAPKKKKRKINLFPTAQPTSFNWTQLSQVRALRHSFRGFVRCLHFVN